MTEANFRPAARRDLAGIYIFTARAFGVTQADIYVKQIELACIAAQSGTLRMRDFKSGGFDFRIHRVKAHMVFQQLDDDGVLSVARILHERMEFEDHL